MNSRDAYLNLNIPFIHSLANQVSALWVAPCWLLLMGCLHRKIGRTEEEDRLPLILHHALFLSASPEVPEQQLVLVCSFPNSLGSTLSETTNTAPLPNTGGQTPPSVGSISTLSSLNIPPLLALVPPTPQ